METRGRPTLKTISQLSGLAVTTVSRALGDAPDIGAETKEKVRRIAAEIGYVPNRAGVRLRTGRTNVIALVLPTEEDALNLTNRLTAAIAGALVGTPYHLVVIPELPDQQPMDPVRYIVETRSADAVILNRIRPEDPRIAFLRERNFPFVAHGRSVWQDDHAYFDFDNDAFGEASVAALAARGRRSILLIAPPQGETYGRDMVRGASRAAQALGVRLDTAARVSSDDPRDRIEACVRDHLARHPETDALIVAAPHAAMAAVSQLEAMGLVIGETVDLFAKETFPVLNMFRPAILTIQEDISKAGAFLARAAINELSSGGKDHMQYLDRPCPDGAAPGAASPGPVVGT